MSTCMHAHAHVHVHVGYRFYRPISDENNNNAHADMPLLCGDCARSVAAVEAAVDVGGADVFHMRERVTPSCMLALCPVREAGHRSTGRPVQPVLL